MVCDKMAALARTLTRLELALPYLIVVPFGVLLYKVAFPSVKAQVVQDSKHGQIKAAFVTTWLKEIATDQVILRSSQVRQRALEFLENLVQLKEVKGEAYENVRRLTYHDTMRSEARKYFGRISAALIEDPHGVDEALVDLFDFELLVSLID
mmetsp:Transcript_14117/g.26454  ORF Transcript_14117/g.26454 Transcript_14117/m.26454 type:complete len:152 (+) Transcript_14117:81-536(+)